MRRLDSWDLGQACGRRLGLSGCPRSSLEFEGSRSGGADSSEVKGIGQQAAGDLGCAWVRG